MHSTAHQPKRRLVADERRTQLLEFGQEFFAHNGFDAVSMSALADRAGVSKGLLYHYFGDRRGFFLATVSYTMDSILQHLERPRDDEQDPLKIMLLNLTDYFLQTRHFYIMSMQMGDPEVRAEIDRVKDAIIENIGRDRGLSDLSPLGVVALRGWMAFSEAAITEWLTEQTISQTMLIDLLISQLAHIRRITFNLPG
jgi:AcrR family transcriptional regulator